MLRAFRRDTAFRKSFIRTSHCVLLAVSMQAGLSAQPQTIPDRLTRRMTPERVRRTLVPHSDLQPYPRAGDAAWKRLAAPLRQKILDSAAEQLGRTWPQLVASRFLDFERNGNRSRYQKLYFERRVRLATAAIAECIEAKGRFLDDVVDGVWLICEESYWGVPAHVSLQARDDGLPDITEPTVDLFAAETAALLAWVDHLLGSQLDGVSRFVRERIALETRRRILEPLRRRDDFWWMGKSGRALNNWTPWICSNWLTAVLLLESDDATRARDVSRILVMLDRFLRHQPADGGCDEGPSYWNRAAGSLFDCLELLSLASNGELNAFDDPVVREMGRFLPRICFGGSRFVNFADASARVRIDGALVYRFGKAIGDENLAAFGAEAVRRDGLHSSGIGRFGSLGRALPALFGHGAIAAERGSSSLPRDVWLPRLQVMLARERAGTTRGFALAAKGGHNAESHNHNDIGSLIVYHDGAPALIDAGVGTYTKKTFSGRRYEIWTMRTRYHNAPLPNGIEQRAGRRYAARDVRYDATNARLELEMAGAYPKQAAVDSLRRRIELERATPGKTAAVLVSDALKLRRIRADSEWTFLTNRSVHPGDGSLVLRAKGQSPLRLTWSPRELTLRVEEVQIRDRKLRKAWPQGLRRMAWSLAGGRIGAGEVKRVSFELRVAD